MVLEEPPRQGGPWPSQLVPDSSLFASPLTEYQVAIISSVLPVSLNALSSNLLPRVS